MQLDHTAYATPNSRVSSSLLRASRAVRSAVPQSELEDAVGQRSTIRHTIEVGMVNTNGARWFRGPMSIGCHIATGGYHSLYLRLALNVVALSLQLSLAFAPNSQRKLMPTPSQGSSGRPAQFLCGLPSESQDLDLPVERALGLTRMWDCQPRFAVLQKSGMLYVQTERVSGRGLSAVKHAVYHFSIPAIFTWYIAFPSLALAYARLVLLCCIWQLSALAPTKRMVSVCSS